MVTVDYLSNYWEIDRLENTKAPTVVRKLKAHFARYGSPCVLISDNGPQFTSEKNFKQVATTFDFEHRTSSPYNSKSNGKAESAIKTAKSILRKNKDGDQFLALLNYRNTPNQSTGTSPTQCFFNRRTRTLLPTCETLLKPKLSLESDIQKLHSNQKKQKKNFDRRAKDLPPLEEGDAVVMQPHTHGKKKWSRATVISGSGRSYNVEAEDGAIYRRNRVHLKKIADQAHAPQPGSSQPTSMAQSFVRHGGDRPVRPASDRPVCPAGDCPVHPAGDSPVHPAGDSPVCPAGDRPVRPASDRPVHPAGDSPVHPAGDNPVCPAGDRPVHPAGDSPVHPAGDSPVCPAGDRPVRPAGDSPIHPASDSPVRPAGDRPVHPAGDSPVRPAGDSPVRPAGDRPVRPAGDSPVRPAGDCPHRTLAPAVIPRAASPPDRSSPDGQKTSPSQKTRIGSTSPASPSRVPIRTQSGERFAITKRRTLCTEEHFGFDYLLFHV